MNKEKMKQINWLPVKWDDIQAAAPKKNGKLASNMSELISERVLTARIVHIGRSDILVIDLYYKGYEHVCRVCLTKNSYNNYFPRTNKWNSVRISNYTLYDWKEDSGANVTQPAWCAFYIGKKSRETMKKFLSLDHEPSIQDVARWEDNIAQKKYDRKMQLRNNKLRTRMEMISDPTKKFIEWAKRSLRCHMITILPYKGKDFTYGICSACGKESLYGPKLKPGQIVSCPCCRKKGTIRRIDYTKKEKLKEKEEETQVILFQKVNEFFVERHFGVYHYISLDKEETHVMEIGRIFLNENGKKDYYYHKYNPYTRQNFWDDVNFRMFEHAAPIILGDSMVYLNDIKGKLVGTRYQYSAIEYLGNRTVFSPIDYLLKYEQVPALEMVVKFGLKKLAVQLNAGDFSLKAKKPWEMLSLTKDKFYRLRDMNGGKEEKNWMEFLDLHKISVSDDLILAMTKNGIQPSNVATFVQQMGLKSILNYSIKQKGIGGYPTCSDVLSDWQDYLAMATHLKMDITKSLIYKPKDLKKQHNALVQLCGGVTVAKRTAEVFKSFPEVENIIKMVSESGIYQYENAKYAIVLPESIEDIIREGQILGHCIDRSDIYFSRINTHESYIFFLRRKEDLESPYYTLEVEPDGTTRQKRTVGNIQDKDFEKLLPFIKEWQVQLQSKLTDDIRELSKKSIVLRNQEFAELRQNQTRVRAGYLMGQLLAEVLEKDLMEVEETA